MPVSPVYYKYNNYYRNKVMTTPSPKNPFIVGKYYSEEYFCDRSVETTFLLKQIENGRDVAIISPRRMGKSGLIHHFFSQPSVKEHYYVFYIDIYATTSLAEFVYMMGKEIYGQLASRTIQLQDKFFQIVKSLRMGFKIDPLTGQPTFDLGLGDIQSPQTSLDEIFSLIEQADMPCIIAIDEFQQIGEYTEKNVEALLRTKIQQCHRSQFIFAGSKRHMMSNMFNSPSKPFYQSAISMGLDPIPVDVYTDFAIRLFEQRGRHLQPDVPQLVWQRYEGYTWFVQMIMNELFALTPDGATCQAEMIDDAHRNVIMAQENTYAELLSNLPPRQKVVLQAIAKEGIANNITSSKFIKKYNLNSASSVQSAVKMLLKNDIITQNDNTYRVYDRFLSEWLATVY